MGVGRIFEVIVLAVFFLFLISFSVSASIYVIEEPTPAVYVVGHEIGVDPYLPYLADLKHTRNKRLHPIRMQLEEAAFLEKQKLRYFEIRTYRPLYSHFDDVEEFEAYWNWLNKPDVSSNDIDEYFEDNCDDRFNDVLKYEGICSNYD